MSFFFGVLLYLFSIFYVFVSCNACRSDGGMASKGLRAISFQVTRNVEADSNPSYTAETLIGYTSCWTQLLINQHFNLFKYLFCFCFISKVDDYLVRITFRYYQEWGLVRMDK